MANGDSEETPQASPIGDDGTREDRPAKKAAEEKPRVPILASVKGFISNANSERAERKKLNNNRRTLETQIQHTKTQRDLENAQATNATEKARRIEAEGKAFTEDAYQETAQENEIAKRDKEHANKMKGLERDDRWAEAKLERKLDPVKKKRRNPDDQRRQTFRNFRDYGSDGPNMRVWKEVYDETVDRYGSWDDVPDDVRDNLMRGREEALRRDRSQGY